MTDSSEPQEENEEVISLDEEAQNALLEAELAEVELGWWWWLWL